MKNLEKDPYNKHQNFLYNRALYGLSIYSREEVQEMDLQKKKRIVRIHKKTQTILNLWKQEIVNTLANKLFTDIFPRMDITNTLVEKFGIEGDSEYVNKMSFKMLNISKFQIVEKLIESKVLPKNFKTLEDDNRTRNRTASKRVC
jgi:hypothetical protein